MSNSDFKSRIERIQSNEGSAVLLAGIGGSAVQQTAGPKRRPVLRVLGSLFCGLLGFAVSIILAFTNANYEKMKVDAADVPDFIQPVLLTAGLSGLIFMAFLIWGVKALLTFKKGRARNAPIAAFFIGVGVASLALRLAAAGG